jgi:hypothetical protein
VKTTLEIPDHVFRKAKVKAAELRIPLRQFVSEAVEQRLAADINLAEKPWMKLAGGLRHLHKDNLRVQKLIDQEFERIEPEDRL